MATNQDTRDRQGFSSTAAPPSDDASMQSASAQGTNTPGDPDSTFPTAGPTDRSEPGTANYRPGPSDASASNGGDNAAGGGANGASDGAASGGSNDTQTAGGADSDDSTSAGGQSASDTDGGGSTADGSGGTGDDSGGGLLGGIGGGGVGNGLGNELGNELGGGLIQDAVADTQSLGSDVLSDAQTGGGNLINDIVDGTGQLVGNAADNLGLGGDGGLIGGITDNLGNGIDLGSILGDGPALTAGVLGDGNGALAQPVSDLTGGLTDGILAPGGDGPILDLGVVGDGSPAVTGLLDDTGDGLLGGLGIGRIADVNGNDEDVSASVGNEPGQDGPIVNAQAFGSGNPPSNNLIDLGAGPNGENSGVIANVFGGSADGSNPQADANLIDAGPNGQTVANADVLTSPDQFQFPVLNGAGTDALAGVLQDGTGPSLVPGADLPAVDIGTNPIVDVDLAGNADAGDTQNPLQAALNGQLLGTA